MSDLEHTSADQNIITFMYALKMMSYPFYISLTLFVALMCEYSQDRKK